MTQGSSSASGGIGLSGILTAAFIILKLCKVIDWKWWSWNPFELSVFLLPVWWIYIIAIVLIVVSVWIIYKSLTDGP